MAIGRIQKNMAFFGRIENFGQKSIKSGHFHSFFFKNTPLQFSFQILLTFQKSQNCNKNSKFLHVWVLTPLNFLLEKIGRKWPYSDFPIGRIQLKVPGNPGIDRGTFFMKVLSFSARLWGNMWLRTQQPFGKYNGKY